MSRLPYQSAEESSERVKPGEKTLVSEESAAFSTKFARWQAASWLVVLALAFVHCSYNFLLSVKIVASVQYALVIISIVSASIFLGFGSVRYSLRITYVIILMFLQYVVWNGIGEHATSDPPPW